MKLEKYLGFEMWNKRDKTKKYHYPGSRDDGVDGSLLVRGYIEIYKGTPILMYKYFWQYHCKPLYTFNLNTLKPSINSQNKTILPKKITSKIKLLTSIGEFCNVIKFLLHPISIK